MSTSATYRATGTVRAVQFTDDAENLAEVNAALRPHSREADASVDYRHGVGRLRVPVPNSDGRALYAILGDWIVVDDDGRVLVLDDAHFRAAYEEVPSDASAEAGEA